MGVRPRAASIGLPLSMMLAGAGCTVGSGSGTAVGELFIVGCAQNGDPYGAVSDPSNPTAVQPIPYDLRPSFFAGEPIEDTAAGAPQNRLIVRMQRDGRGIEVNDTIFFDIRNTYEVARCVRGRTVGGQPDWLPDERVTDYLGQPIAGWCDWSAGGESPRIRLHPDGLIRVSLVPLATCPIPAIGAGTGGVRVTGTANDGWIEFTSFGSANQPTVAPEMRGQLNPDYSVQFGEPLRASFQFELEDARVIAAARRLEPAPVFSRMGGTLSGDFDFDLERGRAAQSFP